MDLKEIKEDRFTKEVERKVMGLVRFGYGDLLYLVVGDLQEDLNYQD